MIEPNGFRGELADGVTAALHTVFLQVENGLLLGWGADDAASVVRWPLAGLSITALDGGRARVTSPAAPDAALTLEEAGAEALRAALPARRGPVRRRDSRTKAIVLYALGAVALAALVYTRLDAVARVVAHRVPPSYEAQLGQGLNAILARQYCETPAARAALDRLVARLGGPGDLPVNAHVMDTPMINAFTLPGGTVVVTRGLLENAGGPDELAGILGHELEHVRRRHVMVHVVRSGVMTFLWQATVGDYSGLLIVDPRTAMDIANLRFSRDDEREADRGALARLDRAGVSRAGFRAFFARMQTKTDKVPAWLSNHPASAERLRMMAGAGEPASAPASPSASAEDWHALTSGCAAKKR